jgi:hypothetical protein
MAPVPMFKTEIVAKNGQRRPSFEVDADSGCWISTGKRQRNGYAMMNSKPAHRVFYVSAFGPMQPGHDLHHLCGTRTCVRPTHLIPVTVADHRWLHVVLRAARWVLNKRPESPPDTGRAIRGGTRAQSSYERNKSS